jgi:hypothetical protein
VSAPPEKKQKKVKPIKPKTWLKKANKRDRKAGENELKGAKNELIAHHYENKARNLALLGSGIVVLAGVVYLFTPAGWVSLAVGVGLGMIPGVLSLIERARSGAFHTVARGNYDKAAQQRAEAENYRSKV